MIVDLIIILGSLIVNLIFGLLNALPSMPSAVISVVDKVFNIFLNSLPLVTVFIDVGMLKILVPIVIAIINFSSIYTFAMYVIRKIPFIGVE